MLDCDFFFGQNNRMLQCIKYCDVRHETLFSRTREGRQPSKDQSGVSHYRTLYSHGRLFRICCWCHLAPISQILRQKAEIGRRRGDKNVRCWITGCAISLSFGTTRKGHTTVDLQIHHILPIDARMIPGCGTRVDWGPIAIRTIIITPWW
jgi:hypothetical protein